MSTTHATSSVAEPQPETAFRALIRTFGLLERIMQPYFARFGISGAQFGVMRTLQRAEQEGLPGLGVTDLSERLWIRPPSVTGVVDRLVRDGLVTREALPADRRVKQIRLTPKGKQRVGQVLEVHSRQIEKILAGLTLEDQSELQRLLGLLGQHLELLADNAQGAGKNVVNK